MKAVFTKKRIILAIIVIVLGIIAFKIFSKKAATTTYQTEAATRGTLITSISGSGTITSANTTNLTSKVSGVVNQVYVVNGATVTKGQKIADVTLDEYASDRQASAWSNYLDATVALKQAQADKVSADINMWNARQAVLDAQEAYNNKSGTDGQQMIITKTLDQTRLAFSVAESKFLNSNANIADASTKVSSALRDYQENSATIVAPVAGIISNLALAPNLVMTANSSTSSTNGSTIVSSQTIGKIAGQNSQLIATVSLSEVDIVGVKANQKVTLTLDAYPDKTFTGKVLSINTSGSVSSGVTSYPVTILLDPTDIEIYPNMAVTAQIITNVTPDVVMIPTTAITTTNGTSTVQIKKNNTYSTVTVTTGASNDSETEIKSGISEGDVVVTAVINASTSTSSSTSTSPFSGLNRTSSGSRSSGATFRAIGGPGF
jgi:multidrug efflux pump subunit AcrA (membrane-fusion protein)